MVHHISYHMKDNSLSFIVDNFVVQCMFFVDVTTVGLYFKRLGKYAMMLYP